MSHVDLMLPYRLNGHNLCGIMKVFMDACSSELPSEVYIDFKYLGFIEPAGITFLSNFIHWTHHKGIRSFFINHAKQTEAIRFLDDSLFFEQHLGQKINNFSAPRSTTQHLRRVGHEESHSWLRGQFVPWLSAKLNTTHASLYLFQVCISEIFNNIQDHTDRDNGSIFVQNFSKLNLVRISIADFGRGIPESVRVIVPNISDDDAIAKAVQRGFTTKSTPPATVESGWTTCYKLSSGRMAAR